MTCEIPLAADGRTAPAIVIAALEHHRLTVVRSFDLRSALMGDVDCGCPDHGTEACQCQYAVLLVYGPTQTAGRPPATVTVHSRAAAAWVTVVQDADAPSDPVLVELILAALAGAGRSAGLAEARRPG